MAIAGNKSVATICKGFDIKRDAYYKHRVRTNKHAETKTTILEMVRQERKIQSRMGTRKLYKELNLRLESQGIKIGRDSLFDILREENMLVKRKRASCRTTNSYHHFHKYSSGRASRRRKSWCAHRWR